MNRIIVFVVLSIPVIFISWKTIASLRSHGLYRFFSWECIAWLLASNYIYWFDAFYSVHQIISWILLILSGYLVIAGAILIKKCGKPRQNRKDEALYSFEKTTELVDQGIFKYVRHPLYASLLFLTWGVFFKKPSVALTVVSVFSSVFLYITAIIDERECIAFFGGKYLAYMKKTKRFIPYLL